MRFELQHPDDAHLKAVYGFDEGEGFFFKIYANQRIHRRYEIASEDRQALERALRAMVVHGFLTQTSVEEAEYWLQYYLVDEIENPAARCAAHVCLNLRRALGLDMSAAHRGISCRRSDSKNYSKAMMNYYQENVDVAPFTTFGVRARARYFATFSSVGELRAQLGDVGDRELLVLGGGSNMLFVRDFEGVILRNMIKGIERVDEDDDSLILKVGAGEDWHEFVAFAISKGLGGVENLSLIPGSVGASPIQNIGAYGVEVKDVFESLEAVEVASGALRTFGHDECEFGYRDSVFKGALKGAFVITSVSFRLSKSPVLNTRYGTIEEELTARGIEAPTIKDVSDAVIAIRQSKLPDPAEVGNSGSFFKNPIISRAHYAKLKQGFSEMPCYPVDTERVKVPAGWLIDRAGWKGKTLGSYGVHKRQALVLVNYGGAEGGDILALSERIIEDIFDRYGICLEREVNIIG